MRKNDINKNIIFDLITAFIFLIIAGFNFYIYPQEVIIGEIWVLNAIIWAVITAIEFYQEYK